MSVAESAPNARALSARVTGTALVISLADGRKISAPLARFPRLAAGSAKQRSHYRIIEGGSAINWPELEEDIGVEPLLES